MSDMFIVLNGVKLLPVIGKCHTCDLQGRNCSATVEERRAALSTCGGRDVGKAVTWRKDTPETRAEHVAQRMSGAFDFVRKKP